MKKKMIFIKKNNELIRKKNSSEPLQKQKRKTKPKITLSQLELEYVNIKDVYQKLEVQKPLEVKMNVIKANKPIDVNKFLIHQFEFGDPKNKLHLDLRNHLQKLIVDDYLLGHILFHGASGSGKYTLVMSLLYQMHGDIINKRYIKTVTLNSKPIKYISNPFYIEILINGYVINDNYTLSQFIKQHITVRYFIIKNFDELTKACQKSIIHIMEKYHQNRFILTTRYLTKIVDNIQSICHTIRVSRPDQNTLAKHMLKLTKLNKSTITHNQISYLVNKSESNINQALSSLELSLANPENKYQKHIDIHLQYIGDLLEIATGGASIQNVRDIRSLVSKLVITTYDVSDIFRTSIKLFVNSSYINNLNIVDQVIQLGNYYARINNRTNNSNIIIEAYMLSIYQLMLNYKGKKGYSMKKGVSSK